MKLKDYWKRIKERSDDLLGVERNSRSVTLQSK